MLENVTKEYKVLLGKGEF